MKFSCEKYSFLSAISTASRAAAVKSTVPALEGLLIEAGADTVRVTGYDLKTGIMTVIPADTPSEGSIVLNARLLGEIVRKLPDDLVYVDIGDSLLIKITCGMSEFEIMGSPADDYPELPSVEQVNSVQIKEKTLKSMIAQTNFAVSDNESRPVHTGELFDIDEGYLTLVAVDGYRLAMRREPIDGIESQKYSFIVPGNALSEVEKILSDSDDTVKITLGSKHVVFEIDGTVLISRRLEGEFLNYRKSIPTDGKYSICVGKSIMTEAVERVSLIISDKLKSPVRCTFEDGILRLMTTTPLGKASDECEVKGDAEGLEIGFNNKYLLDALKAAPAEKIMIRLTSGVSPCVILPEDGSGNFLYMILPVRLKANEG